MRRRILLVTLATALAATHLQAAELDEIIEGNLEARGGRDAITSVDSARLSGRMIMGGQMEAPFTMEWVRPDKFRMEFTVQGQTGVQAYNGDVAWQHMPFMGKTAPEEMAEEDTADIAEQADIIDGPFIDPQEKGHELELAGEADVEGTPAYEVKLTKEDGDVEYIYLDQDYLLTIQQKTTREVGEVEQTFVTTYGDYKEVGGLVFPHYIESRAEGAPAGQVITIESIELGVDLDESRFEMPEVEAVPDVQDETGGESDDEGGGG